MTDPEPSIAIHLYLSPKAWFLMPSYQKNIIPKFTELKGRHFIFLIHSIHFFIVGFTFTLTKEL